MRPSILQQIVNALLQILEAFSFIMRQMIGMPLKAASRLFHPNNTKLDVSVKGSETKTGKHWWKKLFINPISETVRLLFRIFVSTLTFPYRFIKHLWSQTRAELLWCIPAILAVCLMGFVVTRVFAQNGQIQRQYRINLSKAMRSSDFEYGKTISQRLVSWGGETYDSDRFNLAICMLNIGETKLATQILNDLAPNDTAGYAPAHRFKALLLSQKLAESRSPELLEKLRFHLNHADDLNSEQIQVAFALYYVEIGQTNQAISYLKNAAKQNPIHYLTLATIYEKDNQTGQFRDSLRLAEVAYRKLLEENAADHQSRIQLASTLSKLERKQEAETILKQGKILKNDPVINRALADFCVMLFDQSANFEEQLSLLQQSLGYDLNYLPAYQRIISEFRLTAQKDTKKSDLLENLLLSSIAEGDSTPLAHFALSNLKSMQGETADAQFHIERAFSLDPRFGAIANNLAWMLATSEQKTDLDRALELANDVVIRFPEEARFRDTFATILMKQGKYENALTQFELVLPKIIEKAEVHRKLAIIYDNLNRPELANIHRDKAGR